MNNYKKRVEKMVMFDDHRKGIVRNNESMEKAIDERIRRINSSKDVMNGRDDYDDSLTEY